MSERSAGRQKTGKPGPRGSHDESSKAVRGFVGIHVQPRASKTEVAGRHGDAVKIRVRAAPVGGEANDELIQFVATRVGVARSAVRLVSGAAGRQKRICIAGMQSAEAERRLLEGV